MKRQHRTGPDVTVKNAVSDWLHSRARNPALQTKSIAVAILTLEKLRSRTRPGPSGLPRRWEGIGDRQALEAGNLLLKDLRVRKALPASRKTRDSQLKDAISFLIEELQRQSVREPITLSLDRQLSPAAWITSILEKAKGKSGGKVEQHLVGAKLAQRHRSCNVPNFPGHAGDQQTRRSGDFPLKGVSYHVTATDGKEAIPRCKKNLESGVHPVLLVPREFVAKALLRAELEGIAARVTVLSIEDFLAQNVIELATESSEDFFTTIKAIIDEYNRRLEQVETDLSLKIEIQ